ncbi:MAG: hypothetical protein CFE28_04475 [Alphaproteobacteria bacterium PA2]|nr:MAG: hypothetical protein CFE28_04475 [Alphaproteobacteria bacterium PA2]
MARPAWALLICATASLGLADAAWSSGGGGGGGGEMPSASAPTYDPAAEYAKGVAAMNQQNYKAASSAFSHVLEVVPNNPEAWLLFATARSNLSDWKGARRGFDKAVRFAPESIDAHRGLGVALGKLKDPKAQVELSWLQGKAQACGGCTDAAALKAAVEAVTAAMGAAPSAQAAPMLFSGPQAGDRAYVQAVSLINEHRYQDALTALDAARQSFGPHPDILTYQGYTWRKLGALDQAESFYKQALSIAPGHRGATEYYGELKVERGDLAGARAMLARLDQICAYGCAEAEELRRWIDLGHAPQG